jgi:ketosteroid isomerase-like protein
VLTGTPTHEVIVAKGDDTEKSNLEVFRKLSDAFDKHDIAAYRALLTDGVTWSESVEAKDTDKTGLVAGLTGLWKVIPDVHVDIKRSWAMGDYVAAEETLAGTNSGKAFSAPCLFIYKFDKGKLAAGWMFFQSVALGGS